IRSATSRRFSPRRRSISCWSFLKPSGVRITSFKAGGNGSRVVKGAATQPGYHLPIVNIDLHERWFLGGVEIPSRLVLAPMAGVARMVEAAGADIVDMNFGCPVKKVTKTGAGASLLDDPDHACRIVEAVASATPLPVSVKMRRGVENGSRRCLEVGPRLVEAGAASLTLHPRSAKQMYTGTADHSLTTELVSLVDVPVIASGDVTSRARAHPVLATTGAAAVMVGRGAQGNPWALREIMGDDSEPTR